MTMREALAVEIRALAERPEVIPSVLVAACLDVACEGLRDLGMESNDIVDHVRRLLRRERGGDA